MLSTGSICLDGELDKYGRNNFINVLKKYHALISGSVILKAYIDEKIVINDIDVYVPKTDAMKPEEVIKEFIEKNSELTIHPFSPKSLSYVDLKDIFGVYNTNTNLQFIFVKTDNLPEYILNNFDFDICINWFDGDKVYIYNKDGIMKRTVKIMHVRSTFNARYFKYYTRGFKKFYYADGRRYIAPLLMELKDQCRKLEVAEKTLVNINTKIEEIIKELA
jgi:hypothetical protein